MVQIEKVDILANCLGWRPEVLSRSADSREGQSSAEEEGFLLRFSPHLSLAVSFSQPSSPADSPVLEPRIRADLHWTDCGEPSHRACQFCIVMPTPFCHPCIIMPQA